MYSLTWPCRHCPNLVTRLQVWTMMPVNPRRISIPLKDAQVWICPLKTTMAWWWCSQHRRPNVKLSMAVETISFQGNKSKRFRTITHWIQSPKAPAKPHHLLLDQIYSTKTQLEIRMCHYRSKFSSQVRNCHPNCIGWVANLQWISLFDRFTANQQTIRTLY